MKIAIAGTGYVGLSLATLLSQKNEVVALDIVKEKVDKSYSVAENHLNSILNSLPEEVETEQTEEPKAEETNNDQI